MIQTALFLLLFSIKFFIFSSRFLENIIHEKFIHFIFVHYYILLYIIFIILRKFEEISHWNKFTEERKNSKFEKSIGNRFHRSKKSVPDVSFRPRFAVSQNYETQGTGTTTRRVAGARVSSDVGGARYDSL